MSRWRRFQKYGMASEHAGVEVAAVINAKTNGVDYRSFDILFCLLCGRPSILPWPILDVGRCEIGVLGEPSRRLTRLYAQGQFGGLRSKCYSSRGGIRVLTPAGAHRLYVFVLHLTSHAFLFHCVCPRFVGVVYVWKDFRSGDDILSSPGAAGP